VVKDFYLTYNDQFGSTGPQAGAYGVTHVSDSRLIDDEVWYFGWFDGFEGYFFLPEYMMDWAVK
jgi:hypothetical protein